MSHYFFILVGALLAILPLRGQEMSKIKAIVFDFGGVIAKTDKEEVATYLADSLTISKSEAYKILKELKTNTLDLDDEKEFWNQYFESVRKIPPENWCEKFNQARFAALKEIPGMVQIVKNLQAEGFLTPLLSNVRESSAAIKGKLGLYELFSPVRLSYETKIKKPDPDAFYQLLNELGLSSKEAIFIDNKEENVNAARELGFDAILFIDADHLLLELEKREILF